MFKKRSPIIPIALAVLIGLLTIALLNGVIRPVPVVVAKVVIAPGTVLTADLVEVKTVPSQARPKDAFAQADQVVGKMIAVGRAPGDIVTASILGDTSQAGIPAELAPGHVAMAIKVDLASGVAGLLRPGQTVAVIGMLSPEILQATNNLEPVQVEVPGVSTQITPAAGAPLPSPTPTPTQRPPDAPLARIALTGLKVLMVPQGFRYEEVPAGASGDQMFSSARTTSASQSGSVIVVDVPTDLIEITPGVQVNVATLLASLNQFGNLTLALEPADGLKLSGDIKTLNIGALYQSMQEESSPTVAETPAP
ncbi:MAG TPA: Flp pilus assembly protein CpaB [Anaerolineaceae bacterium]